MNHLTMLIGRIKGLRELPGFHAISLSREPEDFEMLTMMASAIAYRKHVGPITLFADSESMQWVDRTGISALYSQVREIGLDTRIDKSRFWAAAKIEAMSRMQSPCCCLDTDAILMKRPSTIHPVVALHSEPSSWEVYGPSALRSRIDALAGRGRPVSGVIPSNTAVLAINDERIRRMYCRMASECMVRESRNPSINAGYEVPIDGTPIRSMVLVEQYLLAALCKAEGIPIRHIAELDPSTGHMAANDSVIHLWSSKRFYSKHMRARERYIDSVMDMIHSMRPGDEVFEVCRENNLPIYRISDGNTGAGRWSRSGEWTGPGEGCECI